MHVVQGVHRRRGCWVGRLRAPPAAPSSPPRLPLVSPTIPPPHPFQPTGRAAPGSGRRDGRGRRDLDQVAPHVRLERSPACRAPPPPTRALTPPSAPASFLPSSECITLRVVNNMIAQGGPECMRQGQEEGRQARVRRRSSSSPLQLQSAACNAGPGCPALPLLGCQSFLARVSMYDCDWGRSQCDCKMSAQQLKGGKDWRGWQDRWALGAAGTEGSCRGGRRSPTTAAGDGGIAAQDRRMGPELGWVKQGREKGQVERLWGRGQMWMVHREYDRFIALQHRAASLS